MGIVHTDQLSQRVVGVGGGQITALLGDDVSTGIVLVIEGDTVLSDLLHQRSSAVRTVTAIGILIGAGQLACRAATFGGLATT